MISQESHVTEPLILNLFESTPDITKFHSKRQKCRCGAHSTYKENDEIWAIIRNDQTIGVYPAIILEVINADGFAPIYKIILNDERHDKDLFIILPCTNITKRTKGIC